MSWAEDKAREEVPDSSGGDLYSGLKVRRIVGRIIRETIERCIEAKRSVTWGCEHGADAEDIEAAIRKLGEP